MDEEFKGLRIAAPKGKTVPSASGEAIAFADLKPDQIVAAMSDEQKAAVTATLAPKAEDEPADKDKGKKKKMPEDMEKDGANAADPDHAQYGHGFAAGIARMNAVFASEHFEGRAAAAAKLLGNAKLSADEITGMLADLPKGDGGADMLATLRGNNPNLGNADQGDGGVATTNAADNHGWGKAQGKAARLYGRKPKKA